ncbi:MAG TPA: FliM/FliN family flagellar motor switch protein [Bryobacteraceae bacterium]|jgi:hypothetical protein|nr:FliM/FliN family flagellar motor switch protein [Bryobacteraceae bacterium]
MALNDVARFADVPIEVEVELDRRVPLVRAILELAESGSIGMTRPAGENIDFYVGGMLMGFARRAYEEQDRRAHHGFQH